MMFWNRGTNHLIPVVAALFTLVIALPGNGHAQNKSSAYRVYDAENLGWLTKVKWGLQWVFVPTALNDIVPFYSYNLRDICSRREQTHTNENQGRMADSEDAVENADWGAILYKDVETAFEDFIGPFAASHNVVCPSVQDLPLEHAAIIGQWHSITATLEKSSEDQGGASEDQDLFLATTRPLRSDVLAGASPRMFVGENYNIVSFLDL